MVKNKKLAGLLVLVLGALTSGCARQSKNKLPPTTHKTPTLQQTKPQPKQAVSFWDQLFDNFHAVEQGKLYRSQQLSPHKLARYIKKHGIKTVINLRGAKHNELWWHLEKTASKLHQAEHHDVPMSAMTFPSRKSLKKLITIYQTAKKPILIHCLGGADRTGEAAAVWALAIQKKNISDALTHLSPWYHHLPYMAPKKQQFIKMWRGIDWALKSYFPPDGKEKVVLMKKELKREEK